MDTAESHAGSFQVPASHGLLQAFATRSQLSDRPLMAVSPHFVMGNWAAQPFLGTLDFEQALALVREGAGRWTAVGTFETPDPGLLIELDAGGYTTTEETQSPSEAGALQRALPGNSKVIESARHAALRISRGAGHALLSGETGTGKSSLADHLLSRMGAPFVTLDVAEHTDWPERLMYALRDRRHVLLRHVSSLADVDVPEVRLMLDGATRRGLRILMTATPCLPLRLQPLVRHLQHRLWIPPLRDRIEDIPDIVAAWAARRRSERLDSETLRWLWSQQWPGNVRELIAAMRGRPLKGPRLGAPSRIASPSTRRVPMAQDIQRRALQQTLDRCEGNRSRAALMLGVSRATLYRKIDQYDLRG